MNMETPEVLKPVEEKPAVESHIEVETEEPAATPKEERTWSEEIEIAGSQLVDLAKSWIAEGNVRRLILRTPDNKLLLEIPLMAGAVVGGVVTIFAPLLAVIGAVASVLAHVKVEVVRVEETEKKE